MSFEPIEEHPELADDLAGARTFDDSVAPQPYRREMPKVGRNDPCPCWSGKKHKKFCGASPPPLR